MTVPSIWVEYDKHHLHEIPRREVRDEVGRPIMRDRAESRGIQMTEDTTSEPGPS